MGVNIGSEITVQQLLLGANIDSLDSFEACVRVGWRADGVGGWTGNEGVSSNNI